MKNTRTIAFLLTLLLLGQILSGCGTTEGNETETEATTDTFVETEPEETRLPCTIPADGQLDGKTIRMLQFTFVTNFNISVEEQTGEIFQDAVYYANAQVMDDLDCTFEQIDNDGDETTHLQTAYTAGEDIYDLVYGTQWRVAPLITSHLFANLNPATSDSQIDLDKPWWYKNYIDETEADNEHTYFLAGDASPDILRRASMMILNTDVLTDIGGDVTELYDTILEGNWTMDEMHELVSRLYIDNDGDGVRTEADTYGYVSWTRSDVDHFMIDAGIRGCSRDENGVPYITFNNESTVKFVEKMVDFLWHNDGSYYVEGAPGMEMLANGQAMLLCDKFSNLDKARDIDANFTIIPVAKLDETIPSYSALVHDDALILCIPIVSQNVSTTTAVLERMAYYYYYDVMPQYYEVVLKSKYRRDSSDAASQILDLIHDGMTTDFAYIYNYGMSNMMLSLRNTIGVDKDTNFASKYAAGEKSYLSSLDKLIEAMRAGNE